MSSDEKKIVELMEKAYHNCECMLVSEAMEDVLSVVKQNLGLVARVCPDCDDVADKEYKTTCPRCHGTGIVARK